MLLSQSFFFFFQSSEIGDSKLLWRISLSVYEFNDWYNRNISVSFWMATMSGLSRAVFIYTSVHTYPTKNGGKKIFGGQLGIQWQRPIFFSILIISA